jgi:hypothetical protein
VKVDVIVVVSLLIISQSTEIIMAAQAGGACKTALVPGSTFEEDTVLVEDETTAHVSLAFCGTFTDATHVRC